MRKFCITLICVYEIKRRGMKECRSERIRETVVIIVHDAECRWDGV